MTVSKTSPYYIQPADIPEREPPSASQGSIAWARANLFGSVADTITALNDVVNKLNHKDDI